MIKKTLNSNQFFNLDCIIGAKKYIADEIIDLIVTDPPYGIGGDKLHKHYMRKEEYVVDGYIEVPKKEYSSFTNKWIKEAERVLKPGGSIYIVSGYTNLIDILNALKQTKLQEVNHLIWKYNFGVYTSKKYVSSHYHILYYEKPGKKRTFNTFCRYGQREKDENGGSLNYQDREDVWLINREYKPEQQKNKNELPSELLKKMILYSSNENDVVCDFFLGSFSTAKIAIGLNRYAIGFELNENAFQIQMKKIENIKKGFLLNQIRQPNTSFNKNAGKPWSKKDIELVNSEYQGLVIKGVRKRDAIEELSKKYGRGKFSLMKILKEAEKLLESDNLFQLK